MKKSEAVELRKKIELASSTMTDENALTAVELFPMWKTATAYDVGVRVQYEGKLYKCIQAHTSQEDWIPSALPALYKLVSIEEYPDWVQPTGAHDAYAAGAKVKHNGKRWVSDVDNNTWAPGTYGWTEVTA